MDVSAATWSRLSKLLDEALDLDEDARAAWLERLADTEPELVPAMRKLLSAHARNETADVLVDLQLPHPQSRFRRDDRVGPYRLKRELGSGGMADVWLAERADGAFVREVALKLPRANRLRRDLAARFQRERDILARLEQTHIARLYDAGVTDDGQAYMAMEYVDGQPITGWCNGRRLSVSARLRLFSQVLSAVQYAHANLVIHRDLKPSNILVTAEGQVRLLDFGIAKLLHEDGVGETELTQASGRALTPEYASPEQICGAPLTIATDIYSLGVVLYELLAGRRPYRLTLESAAQLEQAIIGIDPVRPSTAVSAGAAEARSATMRQLTRNLTGDLDTIVLKTLAKSPAQRYGTVAELAADVERHLAGEPVHARPASWRDRAGKFVVRNRLAVGAAATVGVILVVAAGVSLWEAQVAREQAARAEAVKKFVLSFFEAADTDNRATRKTTAVEMVTQARERLDASPITDVATRVELLTTIGSALDSLGESDQAEAMLAQAARLASERLGEGSRDTAVARVFYGEELVGRRQPALAEAQFDAAEPTVRRLDDKVLLMALLRGRSSLRSNEGDADNAIDLAQQAVRAAEEQQAPVDKRVLLSAYENLAGKVRAGMRKGAIEPARRAYELAREIDGDRPTPMLLGAQLAYANALGDEGDGDAAMAQMNDVLRKRTEMFGANSGAVQSTLQGIGILSLNLGNSAIAIDSFRNVVRIRLLQSAGEPNTNLGNGRLNLGSVYANAHRYEEALAEWREADRIYTAAVGAEHPGARLARSGVALALTRLGRLDDADRVFTALLAHPYSNPTEESFVKGRLGLLRSAQGRHVEAERLLSEALALLGNPLSDRLRALALAELGYARVEAGEYASALDLLQQARGLLIGTQKHGSPDLADIDLHAARAEIGLNRFAEAATHAQNAAQFWERLDPDGRDHAVALLWQAKALAGEGDTTHAAAALRESSKLLATAGLPDDRKLLAHIQSDLKLAKR